MTNQNPDRLPKIEGYDLTTDAGCRRAYKAARLYVVKVSYSGAAEYPTNESFDNKVRSLMERAGVNEPTPEDWVMFAHKVSWKCQRCAGSGQFVTMVVNGKPTGPGGVCFRCGGNGSQVASDAHRNYWHTMKRPVYM